MPRKTWLQRQRRLSERPAGTPTRLVVNLRRPELAQGRDIRPPRISRSAPVAASSIMSTRIVFIGPILILIRTLRLSMRNLPWGFDTTIRLGDGISKNVTWIQLCRRMTAVQACNESGPGWTILLDFRADLWAASGQYRAAEIRRGDSSVRADASMYIPAHQRDRRIGESNSDSRRKEFYEQRREAVSSRDHGRDYAKDREHGRDYAKDRDRSKDYGKDRDRDRYKDQRRGSGRDPTPDRRSHSRDEVEDHRKRAEDSRDKKEGQDTRDRRRDSSPHPARDRSNNC